MYYPKYFNSSTDASNIISNTPGNSQPNYTWFLKRYGQTEHIPCSPEGKLPEIRKKTSEELIRLFSSM